MGSSDKLDLFGVIVIYETWGGISHYMDIF